MKNFFLISALLSLLFGCGGKELFSANKSNKQIAIESPAQATNTLCSQSTHIRPPVDVLILFDNSPSAIVFNTETRNRLISMIQSFAQDNFDYHILVAPLTSSSISDTSSSALFANYPATLTGTALSKLRPTSAISSISFPYVTGGEYGIKRSYEIIQANRSNGIFRNNAFTVAAVLTNGNDTECTNSKGYACGLQDKSFYNTNINRLTCLGINTPYLSGSCSGVSTLNAEMFRLITLSPKTVSSSCGAFAGTYYQHASNEVFNNGLASRTYTDSNPMIMDQAGSIIYNDARDFCASADIFSHIRSSIKDLVIKHRYDRWPVADENAAIDSASIRVSVLDQYNNVIKTLVNNTGVSSPSEGFSYQGICIPSASDQCYTRFYPTPGEPFRGHLIKLHGGDILEFPKCLKVDYYAPNVEYMYVYLPYGAPNESTLELYIGTTKIEKSAVNGWEYVGNKCSTNGTLPDGGKVLNLPTPTVCGPMLKLYGSAIVKTKQGSSVQVRLDYISQ